MSHGVHHHPRRQVLDDAALTLGLEHAGGHLVDPQAPARTLCGRDLLARPLDAPGACWACHAALERILARSDAEGQAPRPS